jgi:molecular chaperone GrpE
MSSEYTNEHSPEPMDEEKPAPSPEVSADDWKSAMRRDFEAWLAAVEEIPDPGIRTEEEPDLFSFYEQLAILSTESRKANRRAADAFSQWGSVLARFESDLQLLRDRTSQKPDSENGSFTRTHSLVLIELLDRLLRLQQAFVSLAPKRSWIKSLDAAWRRAWQVQKEACDILITHFETLLAGEGVERIECFGRTFDPSLMAAAAVGREPARPANMVLEEIARGYLWHGELLRCAQVRVNAPPQNANL